MSRAQLHRLYGFPEVGRYGLAHSLLAWARCELWCRDSGATMLAPSWRHLRIGPYLRRERDKRAYHRLFRFPNYVTGLRRFYLLRTLAQQPAEELAAGAAASLPEKTLVVFRNRLSMNEETHFPEIWGRHEEVRSALRAMTRPRHLPPSLAQPHIAVHVRMGDFAAATPAQILAGAKNVRLPVSWYADMLAAVRGRVGPVAARVYSDGADEALAPLLSMPDVVRADSRAAVTDMLSIAQARLLLSSGSGFSMWGAYLGDVPRICFPSQRLMRVLGQPAGVDREPECESGADLGADFLEAVNARIRAR